MQTPTDPPPTESQPWRMLGLCIAIPVCLYWGYLTIVRLPLNKNIIVDSAGEWSSARNHMEGRPVYESVRDRYTRELGLPKGAPLLFEYNGHPPASVLPFLPLSGLKYPTAHLAFNVVSLIALLIGVGILLGRVGLMGSIGFCLGIWALVLFSSPLALQWFYGQWNAILFLVIVLTWISFREGRYRTAGVLIALAASIKLFPAFLGIVLLAKRRWDGVATTVVAFVAINAIAAAILGWESFYDFATVVVSSQRQYQELWPNASAWGFFLKLFDASTGHEVPLYESPVLARALIGATCLGVTLATYRTGRRAETRNADDVLFAAAVSGMFLVSPITWDHYFLLATLPLAILWQRLTATPLYRGVLVTCIVAFVINPGFVAMVVIGGNGENAAMFGKEPSVALPWQTLTVLSFQTYAIVAMLALCLFGRRVDEQPEVR